MKVLAERVFTVADQSNFASLSGDSNPIHLDELAARKTMAGSLVVHGIHLLCWALESWIRNRTFAVTGLARLTVTFRRGVSIGETVRAVVVKEGDEFVLQIQRDQADVALIQGSLGPAVAYLQALPPIEPVGLRVLDYREASQARGALPLSYCAQTAGRLFPQLSAALPPFQTAALLATTRLVGMECPGLNSLYSTMDLTFDKTASGAPEMAYQVEKSDQRFGLLHLAVQGPGFYGKVGAFLRPTPCRQAGVEELRRLVAEAEFADQRALVIGGSRGLGEVAAKLLAIGGAEVMITYHRGKEDAEAVASEIAAGGGRCTVTPFDSNHPAPISTPQPPTHLYYFATPRITSDNTVVFSPERFAEYCRYYVTGFIHTLHQVAHETSSLYVLYPSTVFLDTPTQMPEYCAAKVAGEELCRQLAGRFPAWRIRAPRLPRMRTDQNNGLLPLKMDASELILLPHLREMHQAFKGERPDS